MKRFVLRHCEAVTVVSRSMLEAVADVDRSCLTHVQVSPMGADLQGTFTPCRETERSKYHLLFVGRLAEKKGLHVLIDALPEIVRRYPEVRLRVVGDGPELAELRARAEVRDVSRCIDWLGSRPHAELVAEYRRATMLVFPSVKTAGGDQEGLGLVPVEALGCECPVVASDLPAIRDVIVHGETGLLASSGDPDSLAIQIMSLLGDAPRRSELARKGRAMVTKNFDWSEVGRRYKMLIESLFDARS
jgi:glycosyltransferase involved in cell wall biosynthesis